MIIIYTQTWNNKYKTKQKKMAISSDYYIVSYTNTNNNKFIWLQFFVSIQSEYL